METGPFYCWPKSCPENHSDSQPPGTKGTRNDPGISVIPPAQVNVITCDGGVLLLN